MPVLDWRWGLTLTARGARHSEGESEDCFGCWLGFPPKDCQFVCFKMTLFSFFLILSPPPPCHWRAPWSHSSMGSAPAAGERFRGSMRSACAAERPVEPEAGSAGTCALTPRCLRGRVGHSPSRRPADAASACCLLWLRNTKVPLKPRPCNQSIMLVRYSVKFCIETRTSIKIKLYHQCKGRP